MTRAAEGSTAILDQPLRSGHPGWWAVLPRRLGTVHASTGTQATRRNSTPGHEKAADAGLGLALRSWVVSSVVPAVGYAQHACCWVCSFLLLLAFRVCETPGPLQSWSLALEVGRPLVTRTPVGVSPLVRKEFQGSVRKNVAQFATPS